MKKISLVCALVLAICCSAFATQANNPFKPQSQVNVQNLTGMDYVTAMKQSGQLNTNDPEYQRLLQEARSSAPTDRGGSLDQGADTCPATAITSLPYSDGGTTAGRAPNVDGCVGMSPDVIYSLVSPGNIEIQVSLCGSSYDTQIIVRRGGACPGNCQIACNDDDCGLQSRLSFCAFQGETYYIIVSGYFGSNGGYELAVSNLGGCEFPSECPPPIGACCYEGLCYDNITQAECERVGGVYGGDYTTCAANNPCPGRCCYTDDGESVCDITNQSVCASLDGLFALGEDCTHPCPHEGQCGPIDLVFAIDNTGSMGGAIANIVASLPNIAALSNLVSAGDLRLGLCTFPNDRAHTIDNLTFNQALVQADIAAISAGGGGNTPEASDETLREIITQNGCTDGTEFTTAFRPVATKIIVLVTDAVPGGCDDDYTPGIDDAAAHQRALDAAALGIRIAAVDVGGASAAILQDYATTTGGTYTLVPGNGSGAGSAINALIEDCAQGVLRLDGHAPEFECVDYHITPNPATFSVTIANTGTAPCHGVSLSSTNGVGAGGTGTILSANPVAVGDIGVGGSVPVNFTALLNPTVAGGLICFRVDVTSADCPPNFIVVCLELPYCDYTLPVELAGFSAIPGNGQVTLNWSTATETNNDHFDVVRNGVVVANVASLGNSSSAQNYTWVDTHVMNGTTYSYQLVNVDVNGARHELSTVSATPVFGGAVTVDNYALLQNYPNPFNPSTEITYDMAEAGSVSLKVFNVMGQLVSTLVNGQVGQGRHTVSFNAASLPSGVYVYKMETNGFSAQRKMLLTK